MSIWAVEPDLSYFNTRQNKTVAELLGIEITDIGEDYIKGTMPADERTQQPIGIIHGGSYCMLAETLGSVASNFCVNLEKYYCVGLDLNANYIRPVREGSVTGIAKPIHLGAKTHVWGIDIFTDRGKQCCVARLTTMVLERKA